MSQHDDHTVARVGKIDTVALLFPGTNLPDDFTTNSLQRDQDDQHDQLDACPQVQQGLAQNQLDHLDQVEKS